MRRFVLSGAIAAAVSIAMPVPTAVAQEPAEPQEVAEGEPQEPAPAEDAPRPELALLATESVRPAEEPLDPHALLAGAVAAMGGEKLDALKTIAFSKKSRVFRAGGQFSYERFETRAYLQPAPEANAVPAGRVDIMTDFLPSGEPNGSAYIVNGDDKFWLYMGREVRARDMHERDADRMLHQELFLLLGPYFVAQANGSLTYDGICTFESFEPTRYVEPAVVKDGSIPVSGWTDYEPASYELHQVTADTPPAFREALGNDVRFWFDADGNLVRFRCYAFASQEYANAKVTFDIEEWQEVGGLRLPALLTTSYRRSAEQIERIELAKIELDPVLPANLLKRP
jgi:hypothetical protein